MLYAFKYFVISGLILSLLSISNSFLRDWTECCFVPTLTLMSANTINRHRPDLPSLYRTLQTDHALCTWGGSGIKSKALQLILRLKKGDIFYVEEKVYCFYKAEAKI